MELNPDRPPAPAIRTSPLAIWSLVLGTLGIVLLLVCIGPLFAVPAVICGHIAHRRIKRSAGGLAGEGIALGGIITGYASIAISVVLIPLLAAIAIPNFVRARQSAQANFCINNLRQIDSAKQQWALENRKDVNDTPTAQDLGPFLRTPFDSLRCPAGGSYTINSAGEVPTCSIQNHELPTGANQPPVVGDGAARTLRQRPGRTPRNLTAADDAAGRFYALNDAAKKSFSAGNKEDARKNAQELLALLPEFRGNWNYGNAVQDANVVLGRIAVQEGNLDEAKQHLIAAGNGPGSPQMNSFGPNMSLAKDLLEKGERESVLEYFELCRKFWKMDGGKLNQWSQEVKAGKTPDFGANLIY